MKSAKVILKIAIFFIAIPLCAIFFSGCAEKGALYYVSFEKNRGIRKEDPVVFKNVSIGKVVSVREKEKGYEVEVRIDAGYQRNVTENARFVIIREEEWPDPEVYVKMVKIKDEGRPLESGSVIIGDESEQGIIGDKLKADFLKNFLIALSGLIVLIVVIVFYKFIVRRIVLGAALIVSLISGMTFGTLLQRRIINVIPEDYHPDLVAFVVVFLVTYFVIVNIVAAMLKPLRKKR